MKAVEHYIINLDIVRELGDRPAEGRAAGNLGNTFYLLGNFAEAINYHQQVTGVVPLFIWLSII